ncbi:MAG: PAS domain-containing protein [Pseudomonadota bacterium]
MQDDDALLNNASACADAMVALFGLRVEVVVHSIATATIMYIANPLSRRRVGDPSYLEEVDVGSHDRVIGPYEKVNWDGHLVRSISVVQRAPDGTARFLVCINFDQADLQAAQRALNALQPSAPSGTPPDALFRNDWHARVNVFVTEWCSARQTHIERLKAAERRALLGALAASGALSEKNAAAYVARVLGVSRATVYNDLKVAKSR